MDRLLLKVATSNIDTDQGTFEAVISTITSDRENDVVEPAAMVAALQKWVPIGKMVPLAWNHSTKAEDQIGHIDPATARERSGEVVVNGWIDQSTDRGREAWRLVKSGTLGFSFGYLVPDGGSRPRKGGGNHITALDVFEATATTTPMNNDTRVLGWKAATDTDQPPSPAQLRILNSMIGQAQEYIAAQDEAEDAAEMAEILETLEELRGEPGTDDEGNGETENASKTAADGTTKEPQARVVDPLREKADAIALEHLSGGESLRKPPQPAKKTAPPELLPLKELKRRMREEMLTVLSGGQHEQV